MGYVSKLIVFCLFYFPFQNLVFAQTTIFPADSAVLLQIYAQCNGQNWLRKWDLGKKSNTWAGVSLDPQSGRVVALDLSHNFLQGTLPNELADLPFLQILNLENNALRGQLPHFSATQTFLHTLRLGKNQFTGTIPLAWQSLNLQTIFLENNQLSGTLPFFLQNIISLQNLDLSNNQFQGTLTGFLDNFRNLQILRLANNQLTGNLPLVLYQKNSLIELDLADNQFRDRIEDVLANLTNLQVLRLRNNQFYDFLTNGIGNLRLLRVLDISNNQFSSVLPFEIGNLSNLEYLDLSKNNFVGGFRDILAPNLYYFNISNNRFQSEIPKFTLFGKLQFVDISNNQLTGAWQTAYVDAMRNCTHIDLSNNAITGSISENIRFFSNIRYLNLSQNLFSGSLPQGLGELTNLEELYLHQNRLSGTVPNLGKLKKLKILRLNNNFLNELPNLKNQIPQIQVLSLENNRFDFGDLEPQMGLPNLTYIPQDSIRIPRFCYLDATAGGKATVYQWFKDEQPIPNSNTPIWTVTEGGRYYAIIRNSIVKNLVFQTPEVNTGSTVPIIDLGADQEHSCGDLNVSLSVGAVQANRFLWSTGDTVRTIQVRRGGVYKVQVWRGLCVFEDSVRINYKGISDNEISANQLLCAGETPKSLIGKLSAINITPKYQWQSSKDRRIWANIDTTENHTPPALTSQNYYRRLVSTKECGTDTSNTILVQVSNIQLLSRQQNVLCAGENNGEIEVQASGGIEPYRVQWSDGQSNLKISKLLPKNYTLLVTDAIGCQRTLNFTITEPSPLKLETEVIQASCSNLAEGGKISLKISGGVLPYDILWNNGLRDATLDNVPAGNYSVRIRDRNQCQILYSTTITRSRPDDSRFSYPYQSFCTEEPNPKATILGLKGGKFTVVPEGVKIDPQTGEIRLSESQAGKYELIYTLNDCSKSSIPLEIQGNCKELVPNTITPNGDMFNDVWEIPILARYPTATVKILNRWGNLLFESKGYSVPFNGTAFGSDLPVGAYFYLIELPNGQVIKGSLSIVR